LTKQSSGWTKKLRQTDLSIKLSKPSGKKQVELELLSLKKWFQQR